MQLLEYFALAFLSGVLLNVMPCVLPILTMKIFHLMESRSHSKAHAVFYTLGIVSCFFILALVVVSLRSLGRSLQWGMHFQSPMFVGILTAVVFAFALNALGVFELRVALHHGQAKHSLLESYLSGIFAAVMSTPCTAPLLITVTGFALALETAWIWSILIFIMIGLGLAFPFLLVSFVSPLRHWLPRPGAWTEVFKQVMGFTLLATSIWLYGVLQKQITSEGSIGFLLFLWVLAVALWGIGRFAKLHHSTSRRRSTYAAACVMIGLSAYGLLDFTKSSQNITATQDKIAWRSFDPDFIKLQQKPVFVDFTADWCAACKTNEQLFIETEEVRKVFYETGVVAVKADMTNENRIIEQWLTKLGRTGIPAYVIYFPDGSYDLLPILIDKQILITHLREAVK